MNRNVQAASPSQESRSAEPIFFPSPVDTTFPFSMKVHRSYVATTTTTCMYCTLSKDELGVLFLTCIRHCGSAPIGAHHISYHSFDIERMYLAESKHSSAYHGGILSTLIPNCPSGRNPWAEFIQPFLFLFSFS